MTLRALVFVLWLPVTVLLWFGGSYVIADAINMRPDHHANTDELAWYWGTIVFLCAVAVLVAISCAIGIVAGLKPADPSKPARPPTDTPHDPE